MQLEIDIERANGLLDLIYKTKELPNLHGLNQAAMAELIAMSDLLERQMMLTKVEAERREVEAIADKRAKQIAKEKAHA